MMCHVVYATPSGEKRSIGMPLGICAGYVRIFDDAVGVEWRRWRMPRWLALHWPRAL